jgi:mannose-6-phosphate isomerase-like protein (cupin superfamily)
MPMLPRRNAVRGLSPESDIPYAVPHGAGVAAIVEGVVRGSNVPIHKHDDEEHYWFILEGSGRAMVDEDEFDVEPGDVVITPAGIRHCIWTRSGSRDQPPSVIRVLEWVIKRS